MAIHRLGPEFPCVPDYLCTCLPLPPSMNTVYIGLDPTAGRRPINYAVLDGELKLCTRGLGKLDKVLEVIGNFPAAVVAVDAPQSPNAGLMSQAARRENYGL